MAQRSPAVKQKDYIQRQYLLKMLNRWRRRYESDGTVEFVLNGIIAWVKAQKSRTTRSGGV